MASVDGPMLGVALLIGPPGVFRFLRTGSARIGSQSLWKQDFAHIQYERSF